jgi:hypothetical protein
MAADTSIDSWPGIIEALRRRLGWATPNAGAIDWSGLPDQNGAKAGPAFDEVVLPGQQPHFPGPFDDLPPKKQPQLSGVSPFQPTAAPPNLPPEEAQLYDILERNRIAAARRGVYPRAQLPEPNLPPVIQPAQGNGWKSDPIVKAASQGGHFNDLIPQAQSSGSFDDLIPNGGTVIVGPMQDISYNSPVVPQPAAQSPDTFMGTLSDIYRHGGERLSKLGEQLKREFTSGEAVKPIGGGITPPEYSADDSALMGYLKAAGRAGAGLYNMATSPAGLATAGSFALGQPEIGAGLIAAQMAPQAVPMAQQTYKAATGQLPPAESAETGLNAALLALPFLHGKAGPEFKPIETPARSTQDAPAMKIRPELSVAMRDLQAQAEPDTITNAPGGRRMPLKTTRGSEPKPEVLEAINKDAGQQNTVAPPEVLEELRQRAGSPRQPVIEPPRALPEEEGEILYGAPDEVAQAESEMHAQSLADYHEHMTRGGDEFLDALEKAGGLPAISSPEQKFRGELQNIREAYRAPRKERIAYSKIFKKNAPDPDVVAQRMRAAGFDVATDTDLLAMAEERLRTGRPIYGMEDRGAGVLAEPGGEYGKDALRPLSPAEVSAPREASVMRGEKLRGFENPIQTIDEVRADLERLGMTPEEREILSKKHWVAADTVDGAINEIFGTRQEALDYMRTMASPGEALVEREAGKPDRIVKRQPENLRVRQEREIEMMRQYFGKSDLTSTDMDLYVKEHGRAAKLRGQERDVQASSKATAETSAIPHEAQTEENAFAQQFFGKNYDELSPDELRTLHNARLHEEAQSELFGKEETPFNLRGEELTQEVGPEGQARANAQAEHEQRKAQPGLFGKAGIERAKEAGSVPQPSPSTATRPAGAPIGAVKGSGRYRRTYQVNKEAGDKINALAASRESAELRAEFQTRNLLGGLSKPERAMLGRYLVSERLKTVNPYHPQILSDQVSANITKNPRIAAALRRYIEDVKPDIESLRKKAGLSESAAAGKGPEFISLIPATKEQLPTKPGELPFKLKSKTTKFAKPASGMAAKYEIDPGKLLRASYTEVMQKARLRDFYQSLKNNDLVSTTPVTEIKGQPVQAVPFGRARKGANGVALPEVSWMPRAIANDLKDVMERPPESSGTAIKLAKAAQRGVTGAALTANPAELINHMRRQLDVVAAMPAANARFTARALEAMIPYFGPRLGVFTRVLLDDFSKPANQAILQDIFDAGGGSARAFEEFQAKIPVLKQIQGATQKLLFGIPKGRGVGGWDLRMRVQLEKIRRTVEGNTDPQRIREFSNQIGQYTKKPDWLIEAVKKVNPYAATTLPMRATELKQAVGTSGLKYKSIGSSIVGRGETLLRGVGGTLLALATTNYLLSGRWPWDNDKGHEFDLNTGVKDTDGKRVYVKLRALAPTLARPVNTLSLPELSRESGARKPQYGAAATIGPFNQVASLLSGGPLGNAAITAGTGYAPYLTRIPGRETNFLDLARGHRGQAGIMNDRGLRAAMAGILGINPIGNAFEQNGSYRVEAAPFKYIERPLPGIEPFGKVFTKSYEKPSQ